MKGLNLYLINGLYWITASLYLPFISMYFSQRGMNSMQVGILSAVLPVASLTVQPLWAALADRTGKRRCVLILLNLCCSAAVLLFPGTESFREILGAVICYALFNSAVLPVCDALVVNQAEEKRINFAWIRMCGTISYAVIVLGMGFLNKKTDQPYVLWKQRLFSGVCTALSDAARGQKNLEGAGTGHKESGYR